MMVQCIHSSYFRKNKFLSPDSFCCKLFHAKSLNMGHQHSNSFGTATKYLVQLYKILVKLPFLLRWLIQQSAHTQYWHHSFLNLLLFKSIFFIFQNLFYLLGLFCLIIRTKLQFHFLFLHKVIVVILFHFKEARYQYQKL